MFENVEDTAALASSEVFQNYLQLRLQTKEAQVPEEIIDAQAVMDQWDEVEETIKSTPKLLLAFRALQDKFEKDAVYRSQTHPQFVEAVMMLNLNEAQ